MAAMPQPRPRVALPGRNIKPFPSRNPSYRALSIIDAYSAVETQPLPQLGEVKEGEKAASRASHRVRGSRGTNNPIEESYASNFDIDEAYGSGDADLDNMDDVINLDEYDPYRTVDLPPRSSSKLTLGELKVETTVHVYEIKPAPPPKAKNGDYDPFKAVSPPKRNPARVAVRELASRSEPFLAVLDKGAVSPAVPLKDASKLSVLPLANKSTSQLSVLSTPRSANTDKALPTVPGVPRKLLASPLEKKTQKEVKELPAPAQQPRPVKILPSMTSKLEHSDGMKKDTRKDSLIQADRGKQTILRPK